MRTGRESYVYQRGAAPQPDGRVLNFRRNEMGRRHGLRKKLDRGGAHLTRWMQALGLVYVLMFLPVRGYGGADAGAVDAGSIQTECGKAWQTEEKRRHSRSR